MLNYFGIPKLQFWRKKSRNNYEQDQVINSLECTKFTLCVVISFIKGKIQRCGESTKLGQFEICLVHGNTGPMNKNRNPIDGANMHKSNILFVKIYKSEIPIHKSATYT